MKSIIAGSNPVSAPKPFKLKTMSEITPSFDHWCVVELFGHTKIAGRVTEQVIGGQAFVRVDVPEHGNNAAFTKLYGSGAIYCMSPCSEAIARRALDRINISAISIYDPNVDELKSRLESAHNKIERLERKALAGPDDAWDSDQDSELY